MASNLITKLSSGKCHVESFNFMLDDGLRLAVADLEPVEFLVPQTNDRLSLWISDVRGLLLSASVFVLNLACA